MVADGKRTLLRVTKMKKAKCDEAAIVSNCRAKTSATTELYVGTADLTLYLYGFAGTY